MDYFYFYDELYKNGYRDKRRCCGRRLYEYCFEELHFVTLLDVGCGWGELVRRANLDTLKATGIDVSKTAVNRAVLEGLDCVIASATKIPFPDKRFGLVTCFDVLEHLTGDDVFTALDEILRVSKKYIALQVATVPTKNHVMKFDKKKKFVLHQTIWRPDTWIKVITRYTCCKIILIDETYEGRIGFILAKD